MNVLAVNGIRLVETQGTAPAAARSATGDGLTLAWAWQTGVLLLIVLAAAMLMRRGLRRSGREEERAFAVMCRRMRLSQRHAAMVRRLAAGIGAAPVALLVSESAFERAVRGAGRVVESATARRTALEVRARVFTG